MELPGVADVDRAKQIIKSTAQLRLTLVERGPFPDRAAALLAYDNVLPPALEVLPGPSDDCQARARRPITSSSSYLPCPAATCATRASRPTNSTVRRSASR